MPLGKYYCDYCDKQFQDTPFARKRHLQSLSHQKSKALWFDSFKEPIQAFTDGYGKGVCNRFVRTGFCQYGDSCKYFHPQSSLRTQAMAGFPHPVSSQDPNTPLNRFVEGSSLTGNLVGDRMRSSWGNLPPSLMPPPEGGYPPLPLIDWG